MPESWTTRFARWGFNWFPAYRACGARIEYIADDWQEVRVRLPLKLRTRNYVGTIYGGAMYSAVDPVYMVMLIKLLGPDFEVWDKAASIRFRRPGRSTLRATFRVPPDDVAAIRALVERDGRAEHRFTVELTDPTGEAIASCEKLLSIRKRVREQGVARAG